MSRLVLLSKSPAAPAIRREHALAALAQADGIEVVFVERPIDLRDARRDARRWLGSLVRPPSSEDPLGRLVSPAVVVPGHLGPRAAAGSAWLLGRALRGAARPGDTVCAMTPWDWPAVERVPDVRRVFDCADDWPALIPGRAAHLRQLIDRAAARADAIVVASPKLRAAFGGRPVSLVRNAASGACLERAATPLPGARRAVYVGTLSERVDVSLIARPLELVDGLRIDLYGPCAYAGSGSAPSAELAALLERHRGRLAWHGPIGPDAVPAAIDAADVALLPFRPELARGDIMKIYDYAARDRPIVASAGVVDAELGPVPGLVEAVDAPSFADAVGAALVAAAALPGAARGFAEANDWESRWPAWRDILLGPAGPR
jgi:glycosyltransferase involved in cell wall biosynthesis